MNDELKTFLWIYADYIACWEESEEKFNSYFSDDYTKEQVYNIGFNDGKIQLAREILARFGKNEFDE